MALKYFLEYTDTIGTAFRCEISDINYSSQAREINGSGRLEFPNVQNVIEPLRGSVFTLDLEASRAVDLNDLYSESETDITVDVFRNENLMFKGFVKPDGIFTDFVNEIYTISLDCIDGLGTLKDLSFVKPSGLHFIGFMKEIDIVYNCLLRTSFDMPINVNIGVFHNEILPADESTIDILNETKLNADRFYKDEEKDNIMDCEEVLKSVLEKYCAIIHQYNGEWFIYRPQDFSNLETSYFYRYESGVRVSDTEILDYQFNLGSQIDAFYPHHCNGNQRININGSVSAFRVNYQYGLLKTFFDNKNLVWNGGNIDGWNILPEAQFTQHSPEGGIRWDGYRELSGYGEPEIESDTYTLLEGDQLSIKLEFFSIGYHTDLLLTIKITNGVDTMYYNGNEWVETFTGNNSWTIKNSYTYTETCEINGGETEFDQVSYGNGLLSFSQQIAPAPFEGEISIIIEGVDTRGTYLDCIPDPIENYSFITEIGFFGQKISDIQKGEIHTVFRKPRASSISEENKIVYNGDMVADIYEGTIKTADNNNTISWRHKGLSEAKDILRIMVEDTLKTRIRPQKVFIGDVYGFAPFLRTFRVNNVVGNYMPISYTYNTKENIVSLELVEVPTDIENISIDYEKTIDYGNVIKPTIV